jgi:hypothetical protein
MSVPDQISDHESRCLADLITLRMLAHGEAGTPLPRWVVVEVARSTGAVLAEAEAAARAVQHAASRGPNPRDETFLRVRLERLTASADEAIAAARAGNSAEMRHHLIRFDALTSAIWAVQHEVYDQARS